MEPPSPSPAVGATPPELRLPADQARELLRKLRDLDLHAPRLAVSGGRQVRIAGCLSLDSPIEGSVRYLVQVQDEPEHVLEIGWRDGCLDVEVRLRGAETPCRRLRLPLQADPQGRAMLAQARARVHPASAAAREFEHFLRRVVRAAFTRRRQAG
ncbi:MAG: hypothetical protein AB1726_15700 [Planctomycetota bacterium]